MGPGTLIFKGGRRNRDRKWGLQGVSTGGNSAVADDNGQRDVERHPVHNPPQTPLFPFCFSSDSLQIKLKLIVFIAGFHISCSYSHS